jgi:hypothetical protein
MHSEIPLTGNSCGGGYWRHPCQHGLGPNFGRISLGLISVNTCPVDLDDHIHVIIRYKVKVAFDLFILRAFGWLGANCRNPVSSNSIRLFLVPRMLVLVPCFQRLVQVGSTYV